MAAKLASGPEGAKATLYDTIRNTLTAARDDAALKAPVRRSSQQALTWLDNTDFNAAPGTTASEQAFRTVHNLRSVLSSVAGGYEDTNRHELAVEARAVNLVIAVTIMVMTMIQMTWPQETALFAMAFLQ